MKIGSLNLNYGRTAAAQDAEADRCNVDVLATQEDVRGRFRERVTVRAGSGVRLVARGRRRANLTRLGYRIRMRYFSWALVAHAHVLAGGAFYVVDVHMPPGRMPLLYPLMARRLRKLLAELDRPYVVLGDFNALPGEDRARLVAAGLAVPYGTRIDHAYVSHALVPYVRGVHYVDHRRKDHHRLLVLTLGV